MKERPRSRLWQAAAVALLAGIGASGCSVPAIKGLQIQEPPEGFFFNANAQKGRRVFLDRDILSEGVWWGDVRTSEPQSDIFITRYAGVATLEDAMAARDVQATRYGNPTSIDYGYVNPVTIDGRAAFTWLETRYDENGAVRSLDYTAVIPYDSVTYAVEFSTSARNRLEASALISVVHSWGEGSTVIYWGLILKIVVGVVLAFWLAVILGEKRMPGTAYRLWDTPAEPKSPTDDPTDPQPKAE